MSRRVGIRAGMFRLLFLLAVAWLSLALPAAAVDESVIVQAERAAEGYRVDLGHIEDDLNNPSLTAEALAAARAKLEDLRAGAQTAATALAVPLADIAQQIARLGQPPPDAASEAPGIAAQRKTLTQELSRLEGAKKQLELIAVEAEQATGRAAEIQRQRFFSRVFESDRSIFNPLLWYDGGLGAVVFTQRLTARLGGWWREVGPTASLPHLLLIPVIFAVAFAVYRIGRRWLTRKLDMGEGQAIQPDELGRLWRVTRAVLATVFFLLALAASVYLAANAAGIMTPRIAVLANALTTFMVNAGAVAVLATWLASPGQPMWRLIDLDDHSARRFSLLVSVGAVIAYAEQALRSVANALFVPISFSVGQSALTAAAMWCIIGLLLVTLRNQPGLGTQRRLYFQWLKPLASVFWLLLAIAAGALFFGYVALANFIVRQIFETSVVVVALALLHHLSDAAILAGLDPLNRFGKAVRKATGLGERGIDRLGLLLRTGIDIVLVVIGLPILLLQWTITWIDVRSWVNTAFFGFRVGNMTLSPYTVFLAISVLLLGIAATRIFARWLDARILSKTRLDKGVQDSIRTGAGYAGYILAAGFALTTAGLDFSNLALIAGALGVGIGFGLQSIVNNFVSGLILLAERPVRVGDWIQIGAGEGLVKKINVRSTEIETFDNCAIIVPNSLLITEPVRNWTHGDTMGRFLITVSVTYAADAGKVRDLLARLAREHPQVLTYPEPAIVLASLGPHGLTFELRAFVADIFLAGPVASELRFAILRTFREAGIEIQVPVQEVRIVRGGEPRSGNG